MTMYLIRNDVTNRLWHASPAEARMYAIGGILDTGDYSVFRKNGTLCLIKEQVV